MNVYQSAVTESRQQYKTAYCKPISVYCFVENIGVEPMTSCVQGRRSSQLS